MPTPQKVTLDVDAFGHGKCVVAGVDLSEKVQRVTIDANARTDELTRVYIELRPGMGSLADVEGVIFERVGGGNVLEFLQQVDAIALEAAAMEMLTGLDSSIQSPTVAMLAVLQKWAADVDDDGA